MCNTLSESIKFDDGVVQDLTALLINCHSAAKLFQNLYLRKIGRKTLQLCYELDKPNVNKQ